MNERKLIEAERAARENSGRTGYRHASTTGAARGGSLRESLAAAQERAQEYRENACLASHFERAGTCGLCGAPTYDAYVWID